MQLACGRALAGRHIILLGILLTALLFSSSADLFYFSCAVLCLPLTHWAPSEARFSVQKWNSWLREATNSKFTRGDMTVKSCTPRFFSAQLTNCWYYRDSQRLIEVGFQHSTFSDKQPQTHTPALSLSSPCALSLSFSLSSAHWYKYTKMWPDR